MRVVSLRTAWRGCVASMLCALSAIAPSTARAQEHALAVYWNNVSAAQNLQAVYAVSKPQPNPDSLVVDGLLRVRAYELTLDKTHSFIANRSLTRAVDREPASAWAHYALGVALARGPDVRERSYAERSAYEVPVASEAKARAPRELMRALELDPSMDAAAFELGTLAMDIGDPALIREAIAALDNPARINKGKSFLFAAKLENRLLYPERAYRYVLQAREAGADPSLAAHEQAFSMFRFTPPNDSAAVAMYLSGIDSLTQDGAVAYFAAIALLVSPTEEKQWHSLDLEHKKIWLRHFWDMHSGLSGTSVTRRIAEHYARVQKAEGNFGVVMTGLPEDPRKPGLIEMLFGGRPTVVETHDQITSLLRHGDVNRVIKYITCEPGWDTLPVPLQPKAKDCMESSYGQERMQHQVEKGMKAPGVDRAVWNWALKTATTGESFDPRYGKTIPLLTEVAQFRAAQGGAEVVGVVSVPGASGTQLLQWAGELDPVLTIALVDTVQDWVKRATTTDRTSRKQFTANWEMAYTVSIPAPPGHNVALRLGLENALGTVGGVAKHTVDVESFDPATLTMSDVVIAPEDAIGSFKRGTVNVALAPGHRYTTDELPVLYYEVYGIEKDAPVKTEIRVEPVRQSVIERMRSVLGRDDGAVTFSFTENATPPLPQFGLQQKRTIGLSQLVPDQYRIRIIITDTSTGRSTSREKVITVEAPRQP